MHLQNSTWRYKEILNFFGERKKKHWSIYLTRWLLLTGLHKYEKMILILMLKLWPALSFCQILNLRLREAEQQRLREAELERQRQLEGRDRLRALNAIQEEVLQLNQLLEPTPYTHTNPTLDYTSYVTRGNQLCSQVSEVVRTTTEVSYFFKIFSL